ncbi:hypothetical protein AMS62_11710 [Bacillus sp. FJAT-18019]|nr:hypothetical protein AMS62_11710 [Bacillus sp. FJAT-18019]
MFLRQTAKENRLQVKDTLGRYAQTYFPSAKIKDFQVIIEVVVRGMNKDALKKKGTRWGAF